MSSVRNTMKLRVMRARGKLQDIRTRVKSNTFGQALGRMKMRNKILPRMR